MMSDESKVSKDDILEQLQAGHRARIDGTMLQNLNKDSVQFHEVMPEQPASRTAPLERAEQPEQTVPESYLNYAAQLLEQMRGVYASSWDNCSCGSTSSWHGGHNHFYDPCSGADVPPVSNCPVYDCSNTCCSDKPPMHHHKPPKPPYHPEPDCGCGTTTYYDDCAYKLQKMSDQLTRIETMTNDMYAVIQQLASYIIEYYNKMITAK